MALELHGSWRKSEKTYGSYCCLENFKQHVSMDQREKIREAVHSTVLQLPMAGALTSPPQRPPSGHFPTCAMAFSIELCFYLHADHSRAARLEPGTNTVTAAMHSRAVGREQESWGGQRRSQETCSARGLHNPARCRVLNLL